MNFALNYKGTITNKKGICVMSMDKYYQFSLLDGIDREFEQDKKSVTAYLNNHPKLEKRKNTCHATHFFNAHAGLVQSVCKGYRKSIQCKSRTKCDTH